MSIEISQNWYHRPRHFLHSASKQDCMLHNFIVIDWKFSYKTFYKTTSIDRYYITLNGKINNFLLEKGCMVLATIPRMQNIVVVVWVVEKFKGTKVKEINPFLSFFFSYISKANALLMQFVSLCLVLTLSWCNLKCLFNERLPSN